MNLASLLLKIYKLLASTVFFIREFCTFTAQPEMNYLSVCTRKTVYDLQLLLLLMEDR